MSALDLDRADIVASGVSPDTASIIDVRIWGDDYSLICSEEKPTSGVYLEVATPDGSPLYLHTPVLEQA